ncbi:MAG: histidinol-phosphate transaminase [Gammaproteobacteria bacterium]
METVVARLMRPDLSSFAAYESARPVRGVVRLHANEASWRADWDDTAEGLNRYPDPRPAALAGRLAALYGTRDDQVLVTRGSDDAIDVLARGFCRAGDDAVLVCPPTFGMYAVAAKLQGARVVTVPLDTRFRVDADAVLEAARSEAVKLVFLCSPNNPTGSLVPARTVSRLCEALADRALVVVDEAYGEFSSAPSMAGRLNRHANLVVLRTLSKAFGLAGARCGALLGAPELVRFLRSLLPPYPLPSLSVDAALKRLQPRELAAARRRAAATVKRREKLAEQLARLPCVTRVFPGEGNFLLARFADAKGALAACETGGVLVRDFSDNPYLPGCLRITVGTAAENRQLLSVLGRLSGEDRG